MNKPQRLKYDPVGWDTMGKEYIRDSKWHGVFFAYTPKLQFIKDGRAVVHYYYEKYGIEAEVNIIIYKKNRKTRKYDLHYTGRLNYTSLEVSTIYASCNIEQTGFIQKFKNSQDVKVNVSAGGSVQVELHSKAIQRSSLTDAAYNVADWDASTNWYADGSCTQACDSRQIVKWNKKYWKSLIHNNKGNKPKEGSNWTEVPFNVAAGTNITTSITANSPKTYYLMFATYGEPNEVSERFTYDTQISELEPVENRKYIFKLKEEGIYQFLINTPWSLIASGSFNFDVQWKITYGHEGNYTTENIGLPANYSGTTVAEGVGIYSETLSLKKDDEVFIYGVADISGNPGGLTLNYLPIYNPTPGDPTGIQYSFINLTAETYFPATTSAGVLWHEAFQRIVQSNTGKGDSFKSAYYGRTDNGYAADGPGSLKILLNGSLIRGFSIIEKPVYISFKDLFEDSLAMDGIGVGVEIINNREKVVVEPIQHFFASRKIAQLPWVRNIEKAVLDDYYFNQIDAGYNQWSNETINNLDEVNAKREYKTSITQVSKKLSLRSSIIASGYTIEAVRRDNIEISDTKDNSRDNDNFAIQLRRGIDGLETERNQDILLLNVFSPSTTYNVRLFPMRCIVRNGAYIRSGLYKQDERQIVLTYGEANTKASSLITGETFFLSEQSIDVNKLDKPIWIPESYSFKTKLSRDLIEAIEEDPYGYIEFSDSDKNWKKGYILSIKPDTKSDSTTFKLLRSNI